MKDIFWLSVIFWVPVTILYALEVWITISDFLHDDEINEGKMKIDYILLFIILISLAVFMFK